MIKKSLGKMGKGVFQKSFDIQKNNEYLFFTQTDNVYRKSFSSDSVEILYKGNVTCLNLVGNLLFFIENNKLYRMDMDGENKEEIKCAISHFEDMVFNDGNLYCNDVWSERTYKMDVKNFEVKQIFVGVCLSMIIDKFCIYYSDDQSGCLKRKLLGIFSSNICNANGVFQMYKENKWIYFLQPSKYFREYEFDEKMDLNIYKVNKDGGGLKKLCEDTVEEMILYNNFIYYNNLDDKGSIYKISTEGTEKEKLNNVYSSDFHIFDGALYYFENNISDSVNIEKKKLADSMKNENTARRELMKNTPAEEVPQKWSNLNKKSDDDINNFINYCNENSTYILCSLQL
jgi:hypothetical protein